MPIILSISQTDTNAWAAGPEGLYRFSFTDPNLVEQPILQPQQHLMCCVLSHDRILVGGAPHGVAYKPLSQVENDSAWQAAYLDGLSDTAALCLTGRADLLLAGTQGGGVLRSTDGGRSWQSCNFGLQDYTVLALTLAPSPPVEQWPQWDIAFAGTETGLYRSLNGGRAWEQCATQGVEAVFQTFAVSSKFHTDGQILAGSEDAGLWRSTDGGCHFSRVPNAPESINALTATESGWLLSDSQQLWQSADGLSWQPVPQSQAALVLVNTPHGLLAGGEAGVKWVKDAYAHQSG